MQDQVQGSQTGLRPFHPADIPEVVDLHMSTIGANLGRRFLERAIYPTLFHSASTGFGFVQIREGKVVGIVAGTLDTLAWQRTLVRTHLPECVLAAARLCIFGWGKILQAVKTARYFSPNTSTNSRGHLLVLVVDGAYRSRGLGVKLAQAFLDYCRSHGMARLWTKTPKANAAFHRLAMHCGFRHHGELSMGGETHVVLCLDFDKADGFE